MSQTAILNKVKIKDFFKLNFIEQNLGDKKYLKKT